MRVGQCASGVLDVYKCIFILQNVIMESNGATTGGALSIPGIFGVKILQSRLLRNRAGAMGGALYVQEINLLDGNRGLSFRRQYRVGNDTSFGTWGSIIYFWNY